MRASSARDAKCPLPVKHLGSRPGSLGSFVWSVPRRPIINWELPKDAPMDGDALIAALRLGGGADN